MKLSRRGLFAALIGAPVALPGIVMAAAAVRRPALTANRIIASGSSNAQNTYNYWRSTDTERFAAAWGGGNNEQFRRLDQAVSGQKAP